MNALVDKWLIPAIVAIVTAGVNAAYAQWPFLTALGIDHVAATGIVLGVMAAAATKLDPTWSSDNWFAQGPQTPK